MTRTQYRVTWTREARDQVEGPDGKDLTLVSRFTKRKAFWSLAPAEKLRTLLESPEPWTAFREFAGKDPDEEWACCGRYECGCGGATIREHFMERRAKVPPLVGPVAIESRRVTTSEWEQVK